MQCHIKCDRKIEGKNKQNSVWFIKQTLSLNLRLPDRGRLSSNVMVFIPQSCSSKQLSRQNIYSVMLTSKAARAFSCGIFILSKCHH